MPVTCVLYGQFNLLMLPHCPCLYLSSTKKLYYTSCQKKFVLHIIVANVANCLMMDIEPLLCLECSLKKLTSQRWVLHIVSITEIVGRRVDLRRKKARFDCNDLISLLRYFCSHCKMSFELCWLFWYFEERMISTYVLYKAHLA